MHKNILFLMTDQFLWDALGFAGHPVVKTPNLDRLAATSVHFPNTYCVSPVCVPARISLFSGQYPHKHGQPTNGPVREATPMMIRTLREAGYHTAAIGKLHFLPPKRETKRFDTVLLHDGYGSREDSAYADYLHRAHPAYAPVEMHAYPREEADGVIYGKDGLTGEEPESIIFGTSKVPAACFYTQWMSDETIRFLRDRRRDAPFFLFCSFIGPHSPFILPEPYASMYDPAEVPLPETIEEDLAGKPASHAHHRNLWGMGAVSEEQLRQITALYFGHITLIDEQIGRILKALETEGLMENTIIAFSADHGEMLGSHGLFYKGRMYDESMRIPLLIRDPDGDGGRTVDGFVSQIDIMPTILDLAGVLVPEWVQGRSVEASLSGDEGCLRKEVFSEIAKPEFASRERRERGYMIGLRDHDFLFSYEFDARSGIFDGELYALADDPGQRRNLYEHPDFDEIVRDRKQRALDWFVATQ